ncbi:MAG: PIN/TRAM domain-containing protein [Phycisphaerales bacterium JB043]
MPDDGLKPYDQDSNARNRASFIRVLRVFTLLLLAAVTMLAILQTGENPIDQQRKLVTYWPLAIAFAIGLFVLVMAIDLLIPVKKISVIGGVLLGLLAGMLAAVSIGFIIDLLAATYDLQGNSLINAIKILIGISTAYLGISIVLQTQDDFRLIIPYVEFAKQMRGVRPILMDSSALIDGRISDVGETGLLQAPIIIPRFVIGELQMLADSSDSLKRARGRRGLDIVSRMQKSPRMDVSIEEWAPSSKGVDTLLVEYAETNNAVIMTTDTGLVRVARIHKVPTINLHDLAEAMKTTVVPGQELPLRIIKPGEHDDQGVAYLEDGTMVVVENGRRYLEQNVVAVVTSWMQTSAGRLLFARVPENGLSIAHDENEGDTKPGPRKEPMVSDATGDPPTHSDPSDTLKRSSRRNPRRN